MMIESESSVRRPDGILIVMAYFLLLSIAGIFYGLVIFAVAVPDTMEIARQDSVYQGGIMAVSLVATFSLLSGILLLACIRGLWLGRPVWRSVAVILSWLLVAMGLAAVPAFWIAFQDSSSFVLYTGIALGVAFASGLCGWYLGRTQIRHYFESDRTG